MQLGAGVEPLELDVLAPADAEAFLRERTPLRRKAADDELRAADGRAKLDGLALALEQAGAYIDKQGLSFRSTSTTGRRSAGVLGWHDFELMQYPASVAVTWETTFAQLTEPEGGCSKCWRGWLLSRFPLFLFDAEPLVEAIPDPREAIAGLAGYSLARFDASGNTILVHRLVQEITRGRIPEANRTETLQIALDAVDAVALGDPADVRNWAVWTSLAPHADSVIRSADAEGLADPTAAADE